MRITREQYLELVRRDKDGTFKGEPGANGRYDEEGTQFPKVGAGVAALILLEDTKGGYDLVMSQRAAGMRSHPNRWALFGGYIEIKLGEGPLEAVVREVRQESKFIIDLAYNVPVAASLPFIDMNDLHNKATMSVTLAYLLRGGQAHTIRKKIAKAVREKDFDIEVQNYDIVPADNKLLGNIAGKGGLAYPQETRALEMFLYQLQEGLIVLPKLPLRPYRFAKPIGPPEPAAT